MKRGFIPCYGPHQMKMSGRLTTGLSGLVLCGSLGTHSTIPFTEDKHHAYWTFRRRPGLKKDRAKD